jgi:hypothetical protein
MPPATHLSLLRIATETRIPMNEIIVMALDAIAEMIENPRAPTPQIVELGRSARRHAIAQSPETRAEMEVARWEMGRDDILRLAESPDVSPEFREFLKKTDENVKQFRQKRGSKYSGRKKR